MLFRDSYAVHMIKISCPHHVFVSKTFKVTSAIGRRAALIAGGVGQTAAGCTLRLFVIHRRDTKDSVQDRGC